MGLLVGTEAPIITPIGADYVLSFLSKSTGTCMLPASPGSET